MRIWIKIFRARKQKFLITDCRDFYFLLIQSYGQFPDLPIVFCEKRENNKVGNMIRKLNRLLKFVNYHEFSKLPFYAVFEFLFRNENWWQNKHRQNRQNNSEKNLKFGCFNYTIESQTTLNWPNGSIIVPDSDKISVCLWTCFKADYSP